MMSTFILLGSVQTHTHTGRVSTFRNNAVFGKCDESTQEVNVDMQLVVVVVFVNS